MQPMNLFDKKFVATTLQNASRCPKCRLEYSYNYDMRMGDSHVKSNRPFLLPCGHNLCENCVYQYRQNLICSVCERPVEITNLHLQRQQQQQHSNFYVRDFFDMNFFLLGELHHLRFYRRNGSTNNTLLSSSITAVESTVTEVFTPKCSECEQVSASGICRQCKVYYCTDCFGSIHMHSKVLKTHALKELEKDRHKQTVQMPKAAYCRRHRKPKDRYCRQCNHICCFICAKNEHSSHPFSSLHSENENRKDDIIAILDNVNTTRENLRKAQKDVKATEMQLKEYATQTLEEISNFFLQLHGFLQNEERRILNNFNNKCLMPQLKVREAFAKLGESQAALNKMRSSLELYQSKPPTDVLLRDVITAYNSQLEHLQCQVQISRLAKNPFVFEPQRDMRKDFTKYYRYEYIDPNISLRIGPMYGDMTRSFVESDSQSSQSSLQSTENCKQQNNQKNQRKQQASRQNEFNELIKSPCPTPKSVDSKRKNVFQARVTYIISPEHFYIQKEEALQGLRELSSKYVSFPHQEMIPKTISEGHCYMAYHAFDKQWYRAMVKKILPDNVYKMFLVDIGTQLEVPKNKICEMDESSIKIPFAAIRCAIYDLLPAEQSWNDEAKNLFMEIVCNKPVQISVIETIKSCLRKVDVLTMHTEEPISVRNSFLYTGLAREKSEVCNYNSLSKQLSPVARINQRLPKQNLQQGDMLTIKLSHIEDPQEFYVIKMDHLDAKRHLADDLMQKYEGEDSFNQLVYVGSLKMACAVNLNDVWQRASIEEIRGDGNISIRLVDDGLQEIVHWRQLYVLKPEFYFQREFAIKCSLADVEPLQKNNYSWTPEAIHEFTQLTSNPTLQMVVCSGKQNEYKVSLHICKKHLDINVGGVLAKYKHCISTGEASQITEVFKTPKIRISVSNIDTKSENAPNDATHAAIMETDTAARQNSKRSSTSSVEKPAVKMLKRTPIKVMHIVHPGEFYIQLVSLQSGISNFHQQIQKAPKTKSTKKWSCGDHCFIYTKYKRFVSTNIDQKAGHDQCEWYRGVIVSIDEEKSLEKPFSVFLRDIGATIPSVGSAQLIPIDREWDCVANAVYRCHLACVEPTGGIPTWSHSASDFFKHTISSFESLSVTLQGKATTDTKSMPIVLWGTRTETADPLAPCVSKHSNINRMLVKEGLAHLVQRLDITEQVDELCGMELVTGQISLEEWFKNFSNNATLKTIDESICIPEPMHENRAISNELPTEYSKCLYGFEFIDSIDKTPTFGLSPPAAWLTTKNIEKSIFAAYTTYVDYDCIVYMHDAEDVSLLTKIRAMIMKAYNKKELSDDVSGSGSAGVYGPGQACIALYHLDNNFYRGIIQCKNEEGEFNVQFIDYGNVESVSPSHMLPYAPFPNVPALACKYHIAGIRPKKGKYSVTVLDIIHKTIVDKLVSVRIAPTEIDKKIKSCSIRVGAIDLAELLITENHVERDNHASELRNRRSGAKNKGRNDFCYDFCNEAIKLEDKNFDGLLANYEERLLKGRDMIVCDDDIDINGKQVDRIRDDDNDDESDDENDLLNAHLDDLLLNMENSELNLNSDTDTNTEDKNIPHVCEDDNDDENQQTFLPPRKRRIFDANDYKQLHSQMQYEDLCGGDDIMNMEKIMFCDDFGGNNSSAANPIGMELDVHGHVDDDDNDEDIVELEHSFALNYWHAMTSNKEAEKREKIKKEICHDPSLPTIAKNEELESSEFEKFQPNDTSTVFSHFSGIESFKCPKLPASIQGFKCRVVSIITPTILQILPLLSEFEYREVELQRRIKHLAKSAPSLLKYEPRQICLACYSKDRRWYRAIIRSYNPLAKRADVLYVDYFNTESVPIKDLKQCPLELINCPLRTFRVRLHGLVPNSHVREKDTRLILSNLIGKRTLYARIKKFLSTSYDAEEILNIYNNSDSNLMEVELYDTSDTVTACPIYELLIQDDFYRRI